MLILVSGLLSLWYLILFAGRAPSVLRSIVKTGAILALAVAAFGAGGPFALMLGLALGALGDFWLSRPGDRAFLAGVAAFAASHVAYISLLLGQGASLPALWLLLGMIAFCVVMGLALWRTAGALRGPVLAYVAIIGAMGALALSQPAAMAWPAVLFILSDTVLAAEHFLWPASGFARRIAPRLVWVSYWMAQAGFLIVFAARDGGFLG